MVDSSVSIIAGTPRPVAALSCRGLTAAYGSRVVVDDVTLEFSRACWHAVVGPNGCGKSTLLRTLAGLNRPRTGTVLLNGRDLSAWPRRERARQLAWLAQGSSPTELRGSDVVSLGRLAHGGWLSTRIVDDTAAVRRAMTATGALQWAHRRVSSLSGGERQRVYLARALAVEATVLMLDEPTTYLDPPHQEDVIRLLRQQAHEAQVCVISAIHDLSLALAADRLIVMGRHGVIGNGTLREALAGDWLSKAFETTIDIVDCQGTPLWRPDVRRLSG